MEILRWIARRDRQQRNPASARPDLKTEQPFWEGLSEDEKGTVSAYTDALRSHSAELGVDIVVLGVGSYAKQSLGKVILRRPHDIDLRVLTSAPSESEQQERVARDLEVFTRAHLDTQLSSDGYTQMSGFKWHLVEAHSSKGTELVPFVDYDSNDIRFITHARTGRRPIDIIISGHGRFDIEEHMAYEAEHKGDVITLLDTRQPAVVASVQS